MSIIFIDGFDHYNEIREKWSVSQTANKPTFEAGRFGGQCIKKQFQNASQNIRKTFASQTEVIFGVAFNTPGFPINPESMFRLEDSTNGVILTVQLNPSGTMTLLAGGQTAVSTTALNNTQWAYIEVRYIAKNTGGLVELRFNEIVVATITGDTTVGLEDDITGFGFMDDGTNSPRFLFDDLYILNADGAENNTFLGDVRITTLAARLDGNRNEWSPSDDLSNNFLMVDEVINDNNSTYVESGLIGAAEDYDNESFTDRAIAPGKIFAVQVANATLRTASGGITYKNEMVVAGVRFSDDIEYTPGNTDYFFQTYPRDTDPSDSLAWDADKVAAVNSGLIITSKVTI